MSHDIPIIQISRHPVFTTFIRSVVSPESIFFITFGLTYRLSILNSIVDLHKPIPDYNPYNLFLPLSLYAFSFRLAAASSVV